MSGDSKRLVLNNWKSGQKNAEAVNISELRAPLSKGWKRETVIKEEFTTKCEIRGEVIYYAPGSQQQLKNLAQIQTVLEQQSSSLTIENFCFSTAAVIGSYLQFDDDYAYIPMTEAQVAKRSKIMKHLGSDTSRSSNTISVKDDRHKSKDKGAGLNCVERVGIKNVKITKKNHQHQPIELIKMRPIIGSTNSGDTPLNLSIKSLDGQRLCTESNLNESDLHPILNNQHSHEYADLDTDVNSVDRVINAHQSQPNELIKITPIVGSTNTGDAPLNLCFKSLDGQRLCMESSMNGVSKNQLSYEYLEKNSPSIAEPDESLKASTVLQNLIEINCISDPETEKTINISELRAPLSKGWKRVTIIKEFTKKCEIEGEVIYYAPGSQQKLKNIAQIQTVLMQQSSSFTTENFSFSTAAVIGSYLQFDDDDVYVPVPMTDAEVEKRLESMKHLVSRMKHSLDTNKEEEPESESDAEELELESREEEESESLGEVESESGTEVEFESESGAEIESESVGVLAAPERSCDFEGEKIILKRIANNYRDEKGFLYSKSNFTKSALYFRCKNSTKYKCLARVIVPGSDITKAVLTYEHSHTLEDENEEELDDIKFSQKLDENCKNDHFLPPRDLYQKTKLQTLDMNSLNVPLQRKKRSFIYRRRRRNIPKLPQTVEFFEELISDPQYTEYYSNSYRKHPFYRGVWRTTAKEENIVLISETILKFFNTLENGTMRVDGTFRALPKHIKFRQLFIISIIYRDRSYPLAYILMKKKNFRSYDTIFAKLKSLLKVDVDEIMADYEAATRKALLKNFPGARLAGCFFHYCQAIRKNAKRFGLSKESQFKQAIKEISALALLPENYVADGFKEIDARHKKSVRWGRFSKYWQKQWLKANISVWGLTHRTNNYAESFNKSINTLLKSKNPNIWILIYNLKKLELDYSDEIVKNSKGLIITTERSGHMKALDENIKNASKLFKKTRDIQRFLDNVTFDLKIEIHLKERINDRLEDEEDDEIDYEIVPNYFKKQCELQKIDKKRRREGQKEAELEKPNKKRRLENHEEQNKCELKKKINKKRRFEGLEEQYENELKKTNNKRFIVTSVRLFKN